MSNWKKHDDGKTAGGALIVADEQYGDGARITLKRGADFYSISLQLRGWIEHTSFAPTEADARREYRAMRSAALPIVELIDAGVSDIKVWEAISEFVRKFS
ncbi:MAG: hypothetical protein LC099_09450 [Anaerolineales bacterium]|nr:hypothetical protein [Anaerolineales bacterium]